MPTRRTALLLLALLLGLAAHRPAHARQDAGYDAAIDLLARATQPSRDGTHNTLLLNLRALGDPDLLPLFEALSASKHPAQRIHGLLGMAQLSPAGTLDLALLAEIEDNREVVDVLSAAIDDGLIDKAGLATVLKWDGLPLAVRQAIALRLMSEGGGFDAEAFRPSLAIGLDAEATASALMQYGIAALIFAERGDAAGKQALSRLSSLEHDSAEAVIAQLLDAAMRHGMRSAGALAMAVGADAGRESALRLLGIQTALRLKADGAEAAWKRAYTTEQDLARRIRLAMVALDASAQASPAMFDVIAEDELELVKRIAAAGKAIAQKQDDPGPAFDKLLELGQPLIAQWVVTYCRRDKPAYGPALLERVIRNHDRGEARHRQRIIRSAAQASHAYCELYPEQATERLPALLTGARPAGIGEDARHLRERAATLLGIAWANHTDLGTLVKAIEPDPSDNFETRVLRLLIRARHGAELSGEDWAFVSDVLQGAGRLELGLRIQLAWAYTQHLGKAGAAIAAALK